MADRPRGLTFEQFDVGGTFVSQARTITEADVVGFAGLSGDFHPLHTDECFARASFYGGRIAHGALTLAVATGLAYQLGIFEGTSMALLEHLAKYRRPVRLGDTIHLELQVMSKSETSTRDRGVVSFATSVLNQHDQLVLEGRWVVMIKTTQGRERSYEH